MCTTFSQKAQKSGLSNVGRQPAARLQNTTEPSPCVFKLVLEGENKMSIKKYDEWVIELDEEGTAQYQSNFSIRQDVTALNYYSLLDKMTDEEWSFLRSFSINPKCCRNLHYLNVENTDIYAGYYFVCGKILCFPKIEYITAQEFAERNFEYDIKDTRIRLGRFTFDIQCPEHLINDIPKDMPEGFICITFMLQQSLAEKKKRR